MSVRVFLAGRVIVIVHVLVRVRMTVARAIRMRVLMLVRVLVAVLSAWAPPGWALEAKRPSCAIPYVTQPQAVAVYALRAMRRLTALE